MAGPPEGERDEAKRRPYEKPAVIHTEKVKARAVVCALSNETCGPNGPLYGS